MKNKKNILLFLLLIPYLYSAAQTYLTPSLGVGFAHIEGFTNFPTVIKQEEGFRKKSLLPSLKIEQYLSRDIFLSFAPNFTNRKVGLSDRGIIGYDRLKYKELNNTMLLNIQPIKPFYAGIGVNFSHLWDFQKGNGDKWGTSDVSQNRNYLGWIAASGFIYRNFILEGSYTTLQLYPKDQKGFVKSFATWGVALGYRIKVF